MQTVAQEGRIKLSEEFLAPYKTQFPDFGALGYITYLRTYSREITDESGNRRQEEWWETVRRVVEGNINLDPRLKDPGVDPSVIEELTREAEQLYDAIFWLKMLPPGRGLWMSGTDFALETGDGLVNCWGMACKPQAYEGETEPKVSFPFVFILDESMKGGGVGFSVERKNLEQIPPVQSRIRLMIVCDETHPNYQELVSLPTFPEAKFRLVPQSEFRPSMAKETLVVPDSREGWGLALRYVIDSHWDLPDKSTLAIDVSQIRPRGTPIKRFGGMAAGPSPLVDLLIHVNYVLNRRFGQRLTSVDCTDICNMIGRCVVAGNVRRTALIAVSDSDDLDFARMKNWELAETEWDKWAQMNHRWASNNSLIVDDPSFYDSEIFREVVQSVQVNGEPGFLNRYLGQNFGRIVDGERPGFNKLAEIPNPCSEQLLESGEPCNLFEVFPYNAERMDYSIEEGLRLAARYCKRVTFANYTWDISQKVIRRNRRFGVSLSGIQDWILYGFGGKAIIDWEEKDGQRWPVYNPELVEALDRMYQIVRQADEEYSRELGVNPSITVTCVKPSGTVALVANGQSPGIHFHYFDYGIRRVRFASDSPLVDYLRELGYPVEPALHGTNTVVVEFPFKAQTADLPGFRSASEVPIEEQFAMQALLQSFWADAMVSCTITFHEHEREKISGLLAQYRHVIKSTSLLPYSGHGYAQAPYEPTSKEEYERRVSQIKPWQSLMPGQTLGDDIDDSAECAGGACPIR